ncbi:LysR family transcriptional regulator [Actinospica sp. MGRD01-02]|uniref:LysR family transcriptional regulator n=1 Tax=Actinospica acidithermotolerans TaxID=2828514 RepID=A0A941IHS7_9ACTN|nr:LysR substrate-binding domain-containing protein [Actinospica acidithermotolerans]MBR7828840.1 LysR family transcriptional regulator [Actinospica acidithermotolerans]
MTGTEAPAPFRLAYVPGVTPGKWVRTWEERLPDVPIELLALENAEAERAVADEAAEAALLRLPIDRSGKHAIALYTETTVLVVPKDHEVAAVDEVSGEDLADYVVLHPLDDCLDWRTPPGRAAKERPATTAEAIELVAAGVGLLAVPQSVARLHHRKDLTYRTLLDAPQSGVALVWLEERSTDLMEEFIGIVRGRTANSSRGRQQPRQEPDRKKEREQPRGKKATPAARKAAPAARSGKPRRRGR